MYNIIIIPNNNYNVDDNKYKHVPTVVAPRRRGLI